MYSTEETIVNLSSLRASKRIDAKGVVIASPSALNDYYAANAGSIQYSNGPLLFYDDLLSLFGRKYFLDED